MGQTYNTMDRRKRSGKAVKIKPLFLAGFAFFLLFHAAWADCAQKDTLIVAYKSHIKTLGFSIPTTRKAFILAHNWADTLVYRDPQKKTLVPCLAESYRPAGKNSILFKLRKGIQFHNGEAFNADAVKASFDYLTDVKLMPALPYGFLKGVEILDDHTVRIDTTVPYSVALDVIANILLIYPPKYLRQVGVEAFGKRPIGTGPYRFKDWSNPSEIVFEANPLYFGGPKGKPKIPNLRIVMIPEELVRVEALLSDRVHLIRGGSVAPDQLQILEVDPNIKISEANTMRIFFLIMDANGRTEIPFFKDKRVRKALNYAIDKESLVKDVLKSHAKTTDSPVTPLHFGYTEDVEAYPYNPSKARKLLQEAGYPNGFEVDLYFIRDESVAERIAEYLNEVGIKTNLVIKKRWRDLYGEILADNTPLIFLPTGGYSIFDASAVLNLYFRMDSPRCLGTNPEIDRLLRQADQTTDPEHRHALLAKVQKIISEEAFWVPLYYGNSIAAMQKDLNFQTSYDEIDRYFTASWPRK
jgi:peptide/nickel transport system substrate-binding protein